MSLFNFILASGDFYRLLITLANSLEPNQDRENVGPDLDPNSLPLYYCSRKIFFFFEKVTCMLGIHAFVVVC